MRPSTLRRWLALYAIDPWDENRADLRAGVIAAAGMEAQGAKKLDGSRFVPSDFTPYAAAQVDPEQEQAALSARLRAALMNASGHKPKES